MHVAKAVHAELEKIRQDYAHLTIVATMDSAIFIQRSIANVRDSAISGSVLVVLVLFLFLRNINSTLIIGITIPISIIATFALMYFYGFTLNTLSFGGLALGVGMLLDNAIVVLDNVFRFRDEGQPIKAAAIRGTSEVGNSDHGLHAHLRRGVCAAGLSHRVFGRHVQATGLCRFVCAVCFFVCRTHHHSPALHQDASPAGA